MVRYNFKVMQHFGGIFTDCVGSVAGEFKTVKDARAYAISLLAHYDTKIRRQSWVIIRTEKEYVGDIIYHQTTAKGSPHYRIQTFAYLNKGMYYGKRVKTDGSIIE